MRAFVLLLSAVGLQLLIATERQSTRELIQVRAHLTLPSMGVALHKVMSLLCASMCDSTA